MDKQQIGSLGLSRKSVEQLERVIDTADTLLYPAHLMIGGWRLFFAACFFAIVILCQSIGWLCSNLYQFGLVNTAVSVFKMAGDFPLTAVIVGLALVVPLFLVMLPITRWFTGLLAILWERIFGSPRVSGRLSAAEIISRGYDPNDLDFEKINGVIYGRRRGT
jgi:hypothetical protein